MSRTAVVEAEKEQKTEAALSEELEEEPELQL